jgi:hypothetical protein
MRKAVVISGLAVLLLAAFLAWQVGACYLENSELQSEMKDLTVQNGARIGLAPVNTEEELHNAVVAMAKEHGIQLAPEQVKVHRTLTTNMLEVSLAADYKARVNLLGFLFTIHFTPSCSHSGEIGVN